MNLVIVRTYEKEQTFGEASFGDFKFKTLELPDLDNQRRISCIPEGKYIFTKEIHAKFGKVLRLKDVPERSGVLVHKGNYSGSLNPRTSNPDTLGCILTGSGFADIDGDGLRDIVNSTNTLNKLFDLLPDKGVLEIK